MQYPYLTFLEISTIILTLSIGIVILYFLIKQFNKTIKFPIVLKAVLLYELCAIIIYSIYPAPIFQSLNFSIIKFIILSVVLFIIFYFITKKYFLINWKKSLIIFILLIIILFPFLNFFRIMFVQKITHISVFAKENARLEAEMEKYFNEYGFAGFLYAPLVPLPVEPLSFKILGKIEGAIFSWSSDTLLQIIIQKNIEPAEKTPEYFVKVISPNGGEKININQPFNIKWDSKNIGSVNISLLSSNDLSFDNIDVAEVCYKVDASLGSCQGILKNFHVAPYYKIRIEGFREKPSEKLSYTVKADESDSYFNILTEK